MGHIMMIGTNDMYPIFLSWAHSILSKDSLSSIYFNFFFTTAVVKCSVATVKYFSVLQLNVIISTDPLGL